MKFIEKVFSVKNENNRKVIRLAGIKVKIKKQKTTNLALEKRISCLESQIQKLQTNCSRLLKFVPKTHLKLLEFHIVEHCNLNCKSCVHFSPLADEEFLDIDTFTKDIQRMAELSGGDVDTINIFGGEPLLHPQLIDFLKISREYFKSTKIQLVTNGILLLSQNNEFWQACNQNSIVISMTKYPINLDYDLINKKAKDFNVEIKFFSADKKDSQWHFPLDFEGKQDSVTNFLNCQEANNCSNVYKGKFYICPIASNMRHFNQYFNTNIPITEDDYIDIYKVNDIKEILNFCSKPTPICEYCNINDRTFNHKWEVSKKDIKEWT